MKPVILITCNAVEAPDLRYTQRAYYTDSVSKAGGLPVLLPPLSTSDEMRVTLNLANGVLFTGSPDIDPSIYGQERHEKTQLIHRRREKFDLEFVKLAYDNDVPMFNICGGLQLLAVALGGTLIQHIPDSVENALQHFTTEQEKPHHDVEIVSDSLLHSIVGKSPIDTNSFHHQALLDVPSALSVTAHAPDGVIEAFEDRSKKFCLGVQWHPERMVGAKEHEALFQAFVEAANA